MTVFNSLLQEHKPIAIIAFDLGRTQGIFSVLLLETFLD